MAKYISIVESEQEVAKRILTELGIAISAKVRRIKPNLDRQIGNLIVQFINSDEVFNEIPSDLFRGLFGLTPKNASNIQSQIKTIARSDFDIRINRLKVSGMSFVNPLFEIGILESGMKKYLDIGEYTSSGGHQIKCMEWLLLQGDRVIINDHSVRNVGGGRGRSGLSVLMVPGNTFRVPPEYSGTVNRNWLIKALSTKRKQLYKQIENILQKEINRL